MATKIIYSPSFPQPIITMDIEGLTAAIPNGNVTKISWLEIDIFREQLKELANGYSRPTT